MEARSVSIPLRFLREVMPILTNQDELHVSLAFFRLLAESGNEESPIAERSILDDAPLRATLKLSGSAAEIDQRITHGLELAVGRSTLLRFVTVNADTERAWYYANTAVTRALLDAMLREAIAPPRIVWDGDRAPQIAADPPNAFRAYEQNIGPLTPIIADHISRAAVEYPAGWIEDAIAEAVFYNKRNWRYISRILENWLQDGRANDQRFQR